MAAPLQGTELASAIRSAALLEGDFVLRSGRRSSYYLDKYRLGTRPELLRALGKALAHAVGEHEPDAVRLAAPELGAVPLAAAAALETELPFVIVRKEAKQYGTANRIEGAFEPGERVCLIEDVVTSGGAAIEAVHALREAGLLVESAVCVLEREEGGLEALALEGVRLRPLYFASDIRPGHARAHG
jgi:orotate phosphoribosyltransferase